MSELAAGFLGFRPSAYPDRALLFRSRAHTRGDAQQDYVPIQGGDPKTVPIRGGSRIADSLGNVFVELKFTGGAIKPAEIDGREIAPGKYDLDVVGHYARPDVFRLSADTRTKPTVTFRAQPALPVVQESDVTTEPNEDALCSD